MLVAFIVAAAVLLIDQISKIIVMVRLDETDYNELIKDFLYFTKVYNKGAGWGMGSGATWLLAIISIAATAAISYGIYKYIKTFKDNKVLAIAAGLCLGGTAGNLIDRVLTVVKARDGVVDFIGMYIGSYEWPVYNIADAALVVGIILFAVWGFFLYDRKAPVNNLNSDKEAEDDKEVHS